MLLRLKVAANEPTQLRRRRDDANVRGERRRRPDAAEVRQNFRRQGLRRQLDDRRQHRTRQGEILSSQGSMARRQRSRFLPSRPGFDSDSINFSSTYWLNRRFVAWHDRQANQSFTKNKLFHQAIAG